MHIGRTAATALVALAVTGCAAAASVPDPVQPGAPRASFQGADPARLVGSWHLRAAGEPADAILTIGDRVDGGLLLFHPCGMFSGGWRANRHGMFVGELDGGDSSCFKEGSFHASPTPRWLARAVSFAPVGRDEKLLDANGSVVATLQPGAHPHVGANDSPDFVLPPVVTAQMRESWREPAPLPDGLRPAGSSDLHHRWVPVGHRVSRAYVAFGDDGSYDGSDGCNGESGRYVLGSDGVVLATSGPVTQIGCENSPLPSWVTQAGRLGLRAGRLLFVSPKGKVLGAASRD